MGIHLVQGRERKRGTCLAEVCPPQLLRKARAVRWGLRKSAAVRRALRKSRAVRRVLRKSRAVRPHRAIFSKNPPHWTINRKIIPHYELFSETTFGGAGCRMVRPRVPGRAWERLPGFVAVTAFVHGFIGFAFAEVAFLGASTCDDVGVGVAIYAKMCPKTKHLGSYRNEG